MSSFRQRRGAEMGPIGPSATATAVVMPVAVGPSPDVASTSRALVRSLERVGLLNVEAGNLVALLHGLRPVQGGWTAHEIEHLRFLRALVERGRIEP